MCDDLHNRIGKVLWAAMKTGESPKPYLCIGLNDGRIENSLANCRSIKVVDLESGETYALLAMNIDELVEQNRVWWDDTHEQSNRPSVDDEGRS